MPKFDADQMFEPIEVTLGGKTYVIKEVLQPQLDEVQRIAKEGEASAETVFRQLAAFLGADIEELKKVDVRKAGAALKFITKALTEQFEGQLGNR